MSSDSTLDVYYESSHQVNSKIFFEWLKFQTGTPVTHNGRVVGRIYNHPIFKKIYVTYRNRELHVYHKWQSIGISRSVLIRLINNQIDKIVVIIKGDDKIYICSPMLFLQHGKTLWFKDETDSQIHLPLKLFNTIP